MKVALSRKNLWERTPALLKNGLGRVLGCVPSAWLLGRAFRENVRFVQEAQWWSVERSREYQLVQLRRILSLAYGKTTYYRRKFQEVGFEPGDLKSPDGVAQLSTIDKRTIRDHGDEMLTVSIEDPRVDYVSTGGTSGEPLHLYIGRERSAIEFAYLTTSWRRAGYHLGMTMAVLRGRVVKSDKTGFRHEYDPVLTQHYYSNFHMTEENMGLYLSHIQRLGPCFLHVYPSSVAALVQFVKRGDKAAPSNILAVLAESENVYPNQRMAVERTFGTRLFSSYGHSEKLVLAAECEYSTDYHVWPTYGYFELLDEVGRPVTTPGQRGEIVGTGFINTVMPFIRYRTGDYATYVGDRCEACGRQHPIIRDIRGHRTQEMLVAADRSEISWTAINIHDDTFAQVQQFQFFQDTPGQAVLRIVPGNGFDDQSRERIHQNLGRKLNGRVQFEIQMVDSISLTSRGKAIYVDQRIAAPSGSLDV